MAYYTCPHCHASLYIIVEWGSVRCPFCDGKINFPDFTIVDLVQISRNDE